MRVRFQQGITALRPIRLLRGPVASWNSSRQRLTSSSTNASLALMAPLGTTKCESQTPYSWSARLLAIARLCLARLTRTSRIAT